MLGSGLLSWAATMFCWDARPPHPRYNPSWRQLWARRLEEAGRSCAATWLRHHTYDEYWRWGSVREDYSKLQIPVLAIGQAQSDISCIDRKGMKLQQRMFINLL